MRDLYCKCGNLVARLEKGSLIKKGATFICEKCNAKDDLYDKYRNVTENRKRDNFNVFTDTLRNSGVDVDSIFRK